MWDHLQVEQRWQCPASYSIFSNAIVSSSLL
jgi:hypothetical protein